jgi:hypothetical protein
MAETIRNRIGGQGMSQIEELQGRIMAAMDRIAQGVDALSVRAPEAQEAPEAPAQGAAAEDGGEIARLAEALDEERLVTAQLEERLKALKARHAEELAEARDAAGATAPPAGPDVGRLEAELHRLRKANDQLRESNAALRAANEEGVGEPHLINKAMLAELESLRAARGADRAEADAILAGLLPLLDQAQDGAARTEEEQA